jgi:hypothetical protein
VIKLDTQLLRDLGLGSLPAPVANELLRHIYETLETRVGRELADAMTNEQVDEFEGYFEAKDDAGAFAWLERNFPNYKGIVASHFECLKREIAADAAAILASAQ